MYSNTYAMEKSMQQHEQQLATAARRGWFWSEEATGKASVFQKMTSFLSRKSNKVSLTMSEPCCCC